MSALTGTSGASMSVDSSAWLDRDDSMAGVSVLRAWHLSPFGALDASDSSSKDLVTPLFAMADWLGPPGPPMSMRIKPSTRPALYSFCSGQSCSAKASGAGSSTASENGKWRIGGMEGMKENSRKRFYCQPKSKAPHLTWLETLKRRSVPMTVNASWTTIPPSMPLSAAIMSRSFSNAPEKAMIFCRSAFPASMAGRRRRASFRSISPAPPPMTAPWEPGGGALGSSTVSTPSTPGGGADRM